MSKLKRNFNESDGVIKVSKSRRITDREKDELIANARYLERKYAVRKKE